MQLAAREIPKIEAALPRRPKQLRDRLLPRAVTSKQLTVNPNLVAPKTEAAEPNLVKLRIERELASWQKSNTDADEPNLPKP